MTASLGSAIGGLVPYFIGRAGGELFLLKRINRQKFDALRHKFEHQEFAAILIPSMLPPPTPWKLFVFGSGVFEMPVLNFMVAVFVGRVIRFGVESLLVIRYGPQILHSFSAHTLAASIVIGAILALAVVFYYLQNQTQEKAEEANRNAESN